MKNKIAAQLRPKSSKPAYEIAPAKPSIEPSLHNVTLLIESYTTPLERKDGIEFFVELNGVVYSYRAKIFHQRLYDLAVLEGFKKGGLKNAITLSLPLARWDGK